MGALIDKIRKSGKHKDQNNHERLYISNEFNPGNDSQYISANSDQNNFVVKLLSYNVKNDRWICGYCDVENDITSGRCKLCNNPRGR